MKRNHILLKKFNLLILIFALLLSLFLVSCSNDNTNTDETILYNVLININEDGDDSTTFGYKVNKGSLLEMPEIPRVDHHECVGFYFNEKRWDFDTDTVQCDLELVAKWVETITEYEKVMDIISKIDVTNYKSIQDARNAYEALSTQNKEYVDNYKILYKAEIEYFENSLKDADTFEKVDNLFQLIKDYPKDTLLKIGNAVRDIYNKRFELTYQDKINDANNHQGEVVKAVGNAFLYKGVYNQYDQTRRVAGSSPYDASEYDTLYLDCSAFCYSVYTYVFGSAHHVNLNTASNNSYAKSHQDSEEILYYIDTTQYTTKESQQALLSEIYNQLQVGDLINYRHGKTSGTAGHVVMYIGNGMIIHSTGDDMSASEYASNPELFKEMQTTTEASIGTVFTFDASQLFFDTNSYRYLFKNTSTDTVWEFAIIRPIANKMVISEKALSNYLLTDVDITKTSSIGARTSVHRGEEVTYTVTLVNHSNQDILNIPIYKEVTKYFDFVSTSDNGMYVEGIGVVHSIDLKAGETKNITYTFKVKDDNIINGTINDGSTYIHNISLPRISNTICYEADMEKFVSNALELIKTKTYETTYDFINDAYKVLREEGISDLFSDEHKESAFLSTSTYKVPDLSKGTTVKRVLSQYLEYGDILIYYNQKTKEYSTYLYVKADLMVYIKNGNYINITSRSGVQYLLDKMFAMGKYQVVRPMMIVSQQEK